MAKAKKSTGFGFKVSPDQRDEALEVLRLYVEERTRALDDRTKLSLEVSVQMMDSLDVFTSNVSSMFKSPAEKAYDKLRFTIIPEFADELGIRSVTYEGIGRMNCIDDIQVKTVDKPGMQNWLKSNDLEDLIVPTVNSQTLSAALRKRLKDGKPMPPEDVVTVTPIVRAQITRSA